MIDKRQGSALISLMVCVLFADTARSQALVFEGSEFAINSVTAGEQSMPEVACIADGRCVVVWTSQDGGGDDGVFVRRLSASGTTVGTDLPANNVTTGAQHAPDVCANAAGGFVVAWSGNGPGDGDGVFARRFDAGGSPVGDELLVNSTVDASQSSPRIACAADGSFVVAWTSADYSIPEADVQARRFDALGAPIGAEFDVTATSDAFQIVGGVSSLPDGSFVVVWDYGVEWTPIGDVGTGILGRRFDADGVPDAAPFVVYTASVPYWEGRAWAFGSDVAHDADGGVVVAWSAGHGVCNPVVIDQCETSYGRLFVRNYAADGTPSAVRTVSGGGEFDGRSGPSVAAGLRGFVAAWDRYALPPSDTLPHVPTQNVFAAPFDLESHVPPSGTALNQDVTGTRRTPAVAAIGDDRYLAVWNAEPQDGSSWGIYARYLCYDDDGDGVCDGDDPCPSDADDDADADGACADIDNCLGLANADQADADDDGAGDACDACRDNDDAEDGDGDAIPDGCDLCVSVGGNGIFDAKTQLVLRDINDGVPGNDRLLFKGTFAGQFFGTQPDLHGARVQIVDASGVSLVDAVLPAGTYAGAGTAGWRVKGTLWMFLDRTDTPVAGITKLRAKKSDSFNIKVSITGRKSTYPVVPGDEPVGVNLRLGDTSIAEGECGEKRFGIGDCSFDAAGEALTCRP